MLIIKGSERGNQSQYKAPTVRERTAKIKVKTRIHECRKKLKQTCRPSKIQQSGSSMHASHICIFILHEVFLYLLCLNLASYQSLMTLLYVKLFERSKLKTFRNISRNEQNHLPKKKSIFLSKKWAHKIDFKIRTWNVLIKKFKTWYNKELHS